MSELYEHSSSTEDVSLSFDRETLGALFVRHPWAVLFIAIEAILLSIAGLIPMVGPGHRFGYVIFGMTLSLALLVAVTAAAIALLGGLRRAHQKVKYATF